MMAEIFGAVSAGVSFAAATGQLIDGIMKLHSFCSQIRDIPDDIQTAVDDLSTMVEVLEFVQVEMGHEILSPQPPNLSSSLKVLSNLEQSSQQVGEVLEEMQRKLGKKRYWGRIKAVGMTRKLEKAAKRVENAQRMVLILLAAENRMTFRQSFNAQRRELTAISTHILSVSSAGQLTGDVSRDTLAINDMESSNTIDKDPNSAGPASHQPIQKISQARGRNTAGIKLRLPNLFLNPVWEFSVFRANQGWDFSLRPYNIRPLNAPIFEAILNGNFPQVCELLHSGRASIWDRDPRGRGVLAFAARSCGDHGSTVLEYLVKSGADIYSVDFQGFPPYFQFPYDGLNYVDEQINLRLVAGYKVFTNHRNWIPSHPSTKVPYENFKVTSDVIDMFPVFRNPPEEILSSVLHEMWPPWKDMPHTDRIKTLFPEFHVTTLTGWTSPQCMRACLSREYIQEKFASWDTEEKVKLIEYAFASLALQSARGLKKGIKEARLFLKDMHMTNSLINTLPEADPLRLFIHCYVGQKVRHSCSRRWRDEKHMNAAQEGLNLYISEMMLLGINMATVIDIERKVLARQEEESVTRGIWNDGKPYKIIAIDYGPKADDWYLWLSNPLDEWAGEFWDMVDHPERAVPGAWIEY